jgi:hypothetical protein
MPIDLATPPQRWRAGLAGGAVTRQPSNDEWPLHGWARTDALAVVTQEVNGASLEGSAWTWSLVRGALMASGKARPACGPETYADQGTHRFDFHLLPGSMADEQLLTAATQAAQPVIVFDRYEGLDRPPWGNNPPRQLWTPAEHRARKDGRMMHLVDDRKPNVLEEKTDA